MSKLKCLTVSLAMLLFFAIAGAQSLIDGPESVQFDEPRNRYLVSNWDNGTIVAVDSLGNHSYFATGIAYCGGICVSGDTLWIAADFPNRVVALDLMTGDSLLVINVSGADFFDSIVLDSSGFVYVTEGSTTNETHGNIYKIKISDQSYYVYADSGIQRPQAIRFDAEENSLIFCSYSIPSRIQKITLNDSTLSTVVESALDIGMDGITFDDFGNTYVSSWTYGGVFRFDSDYTDPPEQIAFGFGGPSALYYNTRDNILAVPDYLYSRIEFIEMYLSIESDTSQGWAPLEVNFTGSSELTVDSWTWDFDDGDSAYIQSPTHTFIYNGVYAVTLEIEAEGNTLNRRHNIIILADTLIAPDVAATTDTTFEVDIYASNAIPLDYLQIPVEYSGTLDITLDSFSTLGCRTESFDSVKQTNLDPVNKRSNFKIWNSELSTPPLEPGNGTVLKLYFTVPPSASPGQSASIVLDGYSSKLPYFGSPYIELYSPVTVSGTVSTMICGDVNGSNTVNILDITYLISFLYKEGPPPDPYAAADVNGSGTVNILDITYLISFLYKEGPEPAC